MPWGAVGIGALRSLAGTVPGEVMEGASEEVWRMANQTRTIEITETRQQPMPLYHTVVHNCSCHTFDDVIFGLMRIVGLGMRDAERKAKEVDFFGSGIVATANFEVAEMYAERLRAEVISASGTALRTSVKPAA